MVAARVQCSPPPLPKLPDVLGGEAKLPIDSACAVLAVRSAGQAVNFESSVFTAARERKDRKKAIVSADPDGYPWVERSELCEEARQAVRGWACGRLSGRQCLLRLERSAEVAHLLEGEKQTPEAKEQAEEEERQNDAGLWVVGCPGLGASGQGLGVFAAYLESKSPKDALADAWQTVEIQCGAPAKCLGPGEINLALRRLSQRSRTGGPDPVAHFLQVQLWRELLQLSTDVERSDIKCEDAHESDLALLDIETESPFRIAEDKGLLCWLAHSEEELRQEAKALPAAQLQQDVLTAERYAVQLLRLSNRLRSAIDGWSRFDAYRVLGVSRSASMAEIRRAFYKKALQTHPDKGGEKEAFQELQCAYNEILDEKGVLHQRNKGDEAEREAKEWEEWQQEQEEREERRKQREEESRRKAEDAKDQKESQEQKSKQAKQDAHEKEDSVSGDDGTQDSQEENEIHDTDNEEAADNRKKVHSHRARQRQKHKRSLMKAAREAQGAAERAGEHATRALRRCHAVIDMLENGKKDSERVWADAAHAMQETARVATATQVASRHTGTVAGILEQLSEEYAEADERIDASCDEKTSASALLTEAAMIASTAASTSHSAAADCAAASMETSASLRAARCQNFAMPAQSRAPDTGILQNALHPLLEVVKAAAVAALEAAEACSEACIAADKAAIAGEVADKVDCSRPRPADSAEDGPLEEDKEDDKENRCEVVGPEGEVKKLQNAEKAKVELETRRALTAWLDIQRVLRRANAEALELLASARNIARKDASVIPELPVEQQSRLFALLAEFLDAAALDFHTMLQKGSPPLESLVDKSFSKAFGFVFNAEPRLAVSVDPRVQILRAALALDGGRVRDMVDSQLRRRLESTVTFVCSMRGSMHAGEAHDVAAEQLQSMHGHLLAVLEELHTLV